MKEKSKINVVWLKRDLRLQDHEPLFRALERPEKVLLLYCFEPLLLHDQHYSQRHWDFIKQSLVQMNLHLESCDSKVLVVKSDVISTFNTLQSVFQIKGVYSHQETGILKTYQRDKEFKRYCRNNNIIWTEYVNNGVFRGIHNRETWRKDWENTMRQACYKIQFDPSRLVNGKELIEISEQLPSVDLEVLHINGFQPGGRSEGLKLLDSFLEERYFNYARSISKPSESRQSCSRLSPYLAWGNLSVREVWQAAKKKRETGSSKRVLDAFTSRLRWQAHFIQKFEMDETMEFESINSGYHKLKKKISQKYLEAWEGGLTGYPLVDAGMRCLQSTGYLNFRMRALVVSFATHHLWQPWQLIAKHLSRVFLDFEPGIHFPQLQMQAGETGINQIRIYNPAKNAKEHDSEGSFILKWVPELEKVPNQFLYQPQAMTYLDQKFCNFSLGKDYPEPLVNIRETAQYASKQLWSLKKDPEVLLENQRILKRHTLPNRNNFD